MNVIIINDFAYVNGGASKVALDCALGLVGKVDTVFLFTAVGPMMPELSANGVRVLCTNQHEIASDPSRLRAAQQGFWNYVAAQEMKKLLGTLNTEDTIIHVHGWTKALSSSPIRVAIDKSFKVICTLHDYFTACPNGGFFNYQTASICTLNPLSLACIKSSCDARSYTQKIWRVARQAIQRKIGLIPDGIKHFVAVSDFSCNILAPHLPINAKIYRIDNPINFKKESPADIASNKAFIMIGRLSKEKGVYLFANAAQELSVDANVVGDGPCAAELRQKFPSLNYSGWLHSEEVKQVLKNARCLVLPSLCYETQGLVVLEAAALGIPAIVPDTSAARDLVVDGKTGLWFKGGDEKDLTEKMRYLSEDGRFAARLGQAAYEHFWQAPPTLDRHVEKIMETYREVLLTK